MNRFLISIDHCMRATTREGDHPDDLMYLDQLGQTVADSLAQLHFAGSVELKLVNTDLPKHLSVLAHRQYPIIRIVN